MQKKKKKKAFNENFEEDWSIWNTTGFTDSLTAMPLSATENAMRKQMADYFPSLSMLLNLAESYRWEVMT